MATAPGNDTDSGGTLRSSPLCGNVVTDRGAGDRPPLGRVRKRPPVQRPAPIGLLHATRRSACGFVLFRRFCDRLNENGPETALAATGPIEIGRRHTKTGRVLCPYRANAFFRNFTPFTAMSWLLGSICRQIAAARAITFTSVVKLSITTSPSYF